MTDRAKQQATQLRNIEKTTGMGIAEFTRAIQNAGMDKHGAIVQFLKAEHGLTHGNANLIAHLVREAISGGPPSEGQLLDAQYAGAKEHLKPILEKVSGIAARFGSDVERVVLKTGVSFRRSKQFALMEAPSSKRVQLSFNLDETPDDDRVTETKGMCTHKMNLTDATQVDDSVTAILAAAYKRAR